MLKISEQGVALIKRFEGFRAQAYLCPGGYGTIGYGHRLSPHENLSQVLTNTQAHFLLLQDLEKVGWAVCRLIEIPLKQGQFDALMSFTYNLGAGALQRSTLRRKVNRQEHQEAALEFSRWIWAGGRQLKGLIRRRHAEALLYSYGVYNPHPFPLSGIFDVY